MTTTAAVTTGVVLFLGAFDLFKVFTTGQGTSISAFLIKAGFDSPVLVFSAGFLAGHLFGFFTVPK